MKEIKKGDTFGRWKVIGPSIKKNGEIYYPCHCSCGTKRLVRARALRHKESKSCGCIRTERCKSSNTLNLKGKTFGELTVMEKISNSSSSAGVEWLCHCSCGNEIKVPATYLMTGRKHDCGRKKHPRKTSAVDIRGRTFGELKAVSATKERTQNGSVIWNCECSCGNRIKVSYNTLIYTNQISCGCKKREHEKSLNKYLTHVSGTSIDCLKSKRVPTDNTTGYKGVYLIRGKYVAKIVFQKRAYYLGSYDEIEEAVAARKKAEQAIFQEAVEIYERWNAKAKADPAWADANPLQYIITKTDAQELSLSTIPAI